MLHLITLYFWINIFPSVSLISTSFIEKSYAVNECIRSHTSEELLLSLSLKSAISSNPPLCTSNDPVLLSTTTAPFMKRSIEKDSDPSSRGRLKNLKKRRSLERKKRQTPSWRQPVGLPQGTVIAFCSSISCCTPKKTLNLDGTTYNLCRECVHAVTLPAGYSPRDHNHVTCQDTDFFETCLTGEGTCTTNTVTKSVVFNNQTIPFIFGQSCSCEIRSDSIFANFI